MKTQQIMENQSIEGQVLMAQVYFKMTVCLVSLLIARTIGRTLSHFKTHRLISSRGLTKTMKHGLRARSCLGSFCLALGSCNLK